MECARLTSLAWDWAERWAGRGKVTVWGEAWLYFPWQPPGQCPWWCFCTSRNGGAGKPVQAWENSWHGHNRAGNRKWRCEVTSRKRWWQQSTAQFGLSSRKRLLSSRRRLLRCEGGGGSRVCSAGPVPWLGVPRGWFILSRHLNNKTKPVKAHLHFCSREETKGYEPLQHPSVTLALTIPPPMPGERNSQP